MRCALSSSSRSSSEFTRAAAALIRPSQRATGVGIGSPETGKFAIALVVSPPQSCCPVAVSVTVWRLARDANAAVGDDALAKPAPQRLVQLLDHRPPDIRTARAL